MHEPQDFRIRSLRGLPIVSTPDEIDIANAPELRDALLTASVNASVVIVDMTETTFCDSNGLHPLVSICQLLQDNGGELRTVCTPPVLRAMAATGDDQLLRIFASLPEALAGKPRQLHDQAA